jgi:hypothetical protein
MPRLDRAAFLAALIGNAMLAACKRFAVEAGLSEWPATT